MSPVGGGPVELVVVSGGARGITARCVVTLAARYGWQFVLLGRTSTADPLPAWAATVTDEGELKRMLAAELAHEPGRDGAPVRPPEIQRAYEHVRARIEIDATLDAVARAGGEAEYLCADVADDALGERLAPVIARRGGVVSGILHGAGAIADRRLEEKTAADFDRVYAPKLRGLRTLLAALDEDDLRFIVLFSSAAAFYGNAGQADYAIANEVLNKAAYRLRSRLPACRVIAFDWGPWAGGEGMVTPSLERLFEERGIDLVPPAAGAAIVADALEPGASPPAQLLVGSPFTPPVRFVGSQHEHRIVRRLRQESNPFLDDHTIGGRRVLPVTCAMAWIADSCEGRYPGLRVVRLNDCRILGGVVIDEGETQELTLDLEETGRVAERSEVQLHATVTGSANSNLRRPLYSAEVVLSPQHPRSPHAPPSEPGAEATFVPGAMPYEDGTLFHGPCFAGIRRILWLDDDGLELECRLADVPRDLQGQFPAGSVNPYVADALFQALLVWVRRSCGSASLPVSTANVTLYRPLEFERTYTVSVSVRERNEHRVVADLAARDSEGNVHLSLDGAEVALSPSLGPLFELAERA